MKFSKKVVAVVLLLNVLFTIAVLYTFLQVGSEPTVLVGAWFAFTTGELWTLGRIKRAKVNREIEEKKIDAEWANREAK